ncbi:MAG: hypothetical protein ACRYFS_16345 [Janthinobacterium lividum]
MTTQVKEGFIDTFRAFDSHPERGTKLYELAAGEKVPFSTWIADRALDSGSFKLNAAGEVRDDDGLDPYEVLLRECNIRVTSDEKAGVYCHSMERFFASDQPFSPILFPEFINRTLRSPLIQLDVLDELIANYSPVDGAAVRMPYLDIPSPFTGNIQYRQMARVAQGAEIPPTTIKEKEQVANLYKYGRSLKITYEALRRIRIDLFSILVSQIALQASLDKAGSAIDVGINGDGNGNPAINSNLTALDPSTTAGNLTYAAWLAWQLSFYPYDLTTVVGGKNEIIKVLVMTVPGLNAQNVFTLLRPGPVENSIELPQGLFNQVRMIYLPSMTAGLLFGLDKRFGLEQLNEIGGTMTETNKWISHQFNEIVISEVVGHDKILTDACRTLNLNA